MSVAVSRRPHLQNNLKRYEPPHDKTNKMACAPILMRRTNQANTKKCPVPVYYNAIYYWWA